MFYKGYAILKGLDSRRTRMTFDLGEFTDPSNGVNFLDAEAAMTDVAGALANVTTALIVEYGVEAVIATDTGVGAGDLFEKALIVVGLIDADNPDKTANVYIPAPGVGIFKAASGPLYNEVDIADASLAQYIQQLEQHTLVSDGETIDATVGTNGAIRGRRVVSRVKLG